MRNSQVEVSYWGGGGGGGATIVGEYVQKILQNWLTSIVNFYQFLITSEKQIVLFSITLGVNRILIYWQCGF